MLRANMSDDTADERSDENDEKRLWNRFDPDETSTGSLSAIPATESERRDSTTGDNGSLGPADEESSSRFDSLLKQASGRNSESGTDHPQSNRAETVDEVESVINSVGAFNQTDSPTQVLLASPESHLLTNDIFTRLLLDPEASDRNVLFLSTNEGDYLPIVEKLGQWTAGETALIDVGQQTNGTVPDHVSESVDVYKPLSSPSNLSKMGIITTHVVSRWSGQPTPTVAGLHSLNSFHSYTDTEPLFQFLYTLCSQFRNAGIMSVYHIDPVSLSNSKFDTFKPPFDLTVSVTPGGDVTID